MRETENRPYVITDYAIPEQEIIPISEDMWLIPFVAQMGFSPANDYFYFICYV